MNGHPSMSQDSSNPMRILFCSRTTLFSNPGGDTVQMVKTADALRAMGCSVDISIDPDPAVEKYDVLHLFNLTRPQETYLQALKARSHGIPVVLSPIYVDYREVDKITRGIAARTLFKLLPGSSAEYLKMAARAVFNREFNRGTWTILSKGFRNAQRDLIQMSALLLPNSESEMFRIRRDFPEARKVDYLVVPNAIDPAIFNLKDASIAEEYRNCVLSVGRIERRKCQLELIRALKGTGLKLVLIGKPGPNHMRYFEQVKNEADENVEILGHLEQAELPAYYAACKVHALVSWMETTGLSSLEAAAFGANIVVTDKGDTRDYFGDHAYYCSPDSIESIRSAVTRAFDAPRSRILSDSIFEKFTWKHAAIQSLAAYHKVSSQHP